MATKKIRIRLKAYEHRILDAAAEKIVETANQTPSSPNFNPKAKNAPKSKRIPNIPSVVA